MNWINRSFKKVLVSCMAFAMMFLTGCENNGFAKVVDGTYDNGGTPVYVEMDDTLSQMVYSDIVDEYNKAPEYLRRNCKGVHIMTEERFEQQRAVYGGSASIAAAGFAYSENLEIYLNNKYTYNSVDETIIHELSHLYDFTHGLPNVDSSDTSEFLALYEAEKYNVNFDANNEYYQNSNQEFFAQCFTYYVLEPERLPASLIQYYDSLPK